MVEVVEGKCEFKLCEDPKTGKVSIVASGPCPPGTMERFLAKIAVDGIHYTSPDLRKKGEEPA